MPTTQIKRKWLASSAALIALAAASHVSAQEAPATDPAPVAAEPAQEIIVVGVRGSLMRSMDAKRRASTIVDAISAEELGKFPDRNVADALGNIPGVTVARGRGAEGQTVTIRGLGEEFSTTTLNGRILPSDSTSRAFAFDVLPSEMISGAEVMKAVQASQIEGSIGGGIDLRSARPFDKKGLQMSGSIEGDYGELSGKTGYKATGVFSNTFANNTMGLLLSLSYSERHIRTDNLSEYTPAVVTEEDDGVDYNKDGTIGGDTQYIRPDYYSVGTVLGDRKRLGVSGAFQYKPSDTLTLTLDALYSYYDTSTVNYVQSNFLAPRDDINSPLKWDPASIQIDSNNVITNFSMHDHVAEVLTNEEPRKVKTYQVGAHADWQLSDRLNIDLDVYASEARRDDAGKSRFVVAGILGANTTFATRDGGLPDLDITLPGGRSLDEATDDDYRAHYIGIQGDNLRDQIKGFKADGKYDFDNVFGGHLTSVQFGINYTDRRKIDETYDNAYTTSCSYCGYPFTFGEIGAQVIRQLPVKDLLDGVDGNFPRSFAAFDIDTYLAALPNADNNPDILDPNTGEPYPAGYSTQVIEKDLPLSFEVSEKTTAAYVQANFSGNKWRGDIGVRLISTEVKSQGASIEILSITKLPGNTADYDIEVSDPTPVEGGGKYTKALPSVNFAYDFTDTLRLRLAAAKVIARPSFDQLSPASDASSASSGTFIIYNAGNPNLQPTTADQYDASLEWYPNRSSSFSFAVFTKNIENFVTTVNEDQEIAGQDFTVVSVQNGDSAKVTGAELAGQYLFENGFGLQANATWNHSEAHLGGVTGELDGAIPFSYNLKAFYEKHGWSAQVSYAFASKFTSRISGTIPGFPEKELAYEELSAGFGYEITPNVKLFVEGSNLLNEVTQRYSAYTNVPAFYETSGRSIFFGVRARM